MIERCPNCGAPVRSGAKFCTTCGLRLPETQVEVPVAVEEAVAAPAATAGGTDRYGSWASGSAASEQNGTPGREEEQREDAEPASGDEAIPMPEGGDPFRGWPSWVSQAGATEEQEGAAEAAPEAVEAAPEPEVDEPSVEAAAEPAAAAEQDALEMGSGLDETGVVVPSSEEPAEAVAPVAEMEEAFAAESSPEPEAVIIAAPEESQQEDLREPDQQRVGRIVFATPAEGSTEEPLARANTLLDELRAVVETLAARPAAPAPAVDQEAVAAELAAALDETDDGAPEDFDALRDTVTTATERPRDVDTMLALMSRLDDVVALLGRHDRQESAIKRAVAALRAEGQAPTEG